MEYDTLLKKINDFSLAKRQWMEARKTSVMESCDLETLRHQVNMLKENFIQPKKDWLMLNANIA